MKDYACEFLCGTFLTTHVGLITRQYPAQSAAVSFAWTSLVYEHGTWHYEYPGRYRKDERHSLALLFTCRQTYGEARLLPARLATFAFNDPPKEDLEDWLERAPASATAVQNKIIVKVTVEAVDAEHVSVETHMWEGDRDMWKQINRARLPALDQIHIVVSLYIVSHSESLLRRTQRWTDKPGVEIKRKVQEEVAMMEGGLTRVNEGVKAWVHIDYDGITDDF